jgi:hypothetical protein
MSLTKQHQASLRNNRPALVKSLQLTEGIFSRLLSDYSLNEEMVDTIRAEKTRAEKVGRLVTLLGSRPEKAFATFIEALVEDDQDEFALLLDKTMPNHLLQRRSRTGMMRMVHYPPQPLGSHSQASQKLAAVITQGHPGSRINSPVHSEHLLKLWMASCRVGNSWLFSISVDCHLDPQKVISSLAIPLVVISVITGKCCPL